ncbi:MAG: GNAT family N-acetyltransferase [Bacillota bacterium]
MELDIRHLETPEAFRQAEALQALVWGKEDVVPRHHLVAACRNGGLALGAYSGADLIGFVYGFPGHAAGEAWLVSQLLAVHPAHRGRGLGLALKLAQRRAALTAGYTSISWTYDPLEAVNASLNLQGLRARGVRFVADYYGAMDDLLNAGLPSDRLVIRWDLREPRVAQAAAGEPSAWRPAGEPRALGIDRAQPVALASYPEARAVLVAIPLGFQAMKGAGGETPLRWRLAVRHAFQHYLARGFRAEEFALDQAQAAGWYLLTQGE